MEKVMNFDRNTKFLMIALICGLFLNGLNPWIKPSDVGAKENIAIAESGNNSDCNSARKNSIKSLDGVNTIERIVGYIEAKVNDIERGVSEIDRKLEGISPPYQKK
jgi:hypothetical protein